MNSTWMDLMRPSWRLAFNSLIAKRGRTVLLIITVALATSLIMTVSCIMASAQATLNHELQKIMGGADARVVHQFGGRFVEELLEQIKAWPEVKNAVGASRATVSVLNPSQQRLFSGRSGVGESAVAIGLELDRISEFRNFELRDGRMAQSRDEVIIGPAAAEKLQLNVGDRLLVKGRDGVINLTVTGIYDRHYLMFMQLPRIYLDRRALEGAYGEHGFVNNISIQLRTRQDVSAFCAKYQTQMPLNMVIEPAESWRSGIDRRLRAADFGFLISSVLTFLAATFIIITGMTTGVSEQQRELAILRCIGAARGQLVVAQLLAGGVIGGVGGIIGLPMGLGLAGLFVYVFRDLVSEGLHVAPLGILMTIMGAICAGLSGAVYPAILAGRIAPLHALTVVSRPVRSGAIMLCAAIGLIMGLGQLLVMLPDDRSLRFWLHITIGLPLLIIAYFILAVPVMVLVTMALSNVVSFVVRLPAGLLRGSILATPFRHGFTAGALMVGMALLVGTWSESRMIFSKFIDQIYFADGMAYSPLGINDQQQKAIAELSFVGAVCPLSYVSVEITGEQLFGVKGLSPKNIVCIGFEPDQFFRINAIEWVVGDFDCAVKRLKQGDAVVVAEQFLNRGKSVGDFIELGNSRVHYTFEIVGVVRSAGLEMIIQQFGIQNQYAEYALSSVFMDFDVLAERFDVSVPTLVQVTLKDDITDEEAMRRVRQAAPGVLFVSGRWIRETIQEVATGMLAVYSAIAYAALLLACLGVGNVILANIQSRRFEYGVLRAVGAHRGLLFRLVLSEAALIAVAAGITGIGLGMHLVIVAAIHYRGLLGIELSPQLPVGPSALGWLVLLVMTLAAALPGALSLRRGTPSTLLNAGRNG